jgi:beta-glucosidase
MTNAALPSPAFAPQKQSVEAHIEAALARLSAPQRIAQLCGVFFRDLLVDGRLSTEACERRIPHGVGHVCQFASCTPLRPVELVREVTALQDWLHARVGIRAIFHEEAITGLAARGATTFPQQIGMSCTWDPALVEENARAIADTVLASGATQCLSPMLDVLDDARWGRCEEGFGESPLLTALFGLAFVRGLQSRGVAATAKHFLGYGCLEGLAGAELGAALLPHEAVIGMGGVAALMPGYHALDGVPCHASPPLLRELLRERLGFSGLVVSDYGAIAQIAHHYRQAADLPSAGSAALAAGVDVDLPFGEAFSGMIADPAALDEALRRVLRLKERLGLLSAPAAPSVSTPDFDPPAHRERAARSAAASLVLLRNDGILPLHEGIHSIALVGPNADSAYALLGDYTYQTLAEFWWRHPIDSDAPRLWTLLAGLRDRLPPGVLLRHARGCDWSSPIAAETSTLGDQRAAQASRTPLEKVVRTDADEALRLAAESDLIIAALGENRYLCGETRNRNDVELPGDQGVFLDRLLDTGKPLVLILCGGRPLALGERAARCAAIVQAWYPGQAGGLALADLLYGRSEPEGRLSVSMARVSAQLPVSHRRACEAPLFPFGHGLSYTAFAYSGLSSPSSLSTDDEAIELIWNIANIGARPGVEVAQVYTAGTAGLELLGFARLRLESGAAARVRVCLWLEQLAERLPSGLRRIRAGRWPLLIGASAADIRFRVEVGIHGPERMSDRLDRILPTSSVERLPASLPMEA